MRIDQHLAEHDALRGEYLQQQALRAFETLRREIRAAQPILVRHHDELVAGVADLQQRRNHALDQAEFFVAVDLEVFGFLDQHAIAVDEQDTAHAQASCRRAASNWSFSAGVPILMRSASPSPGMARMSRTTMPASSQRDSIASASSNRASR